MLPSHIEEMVGWWSNTKNYDLVESFRRKGYTRDCIIEWVLERAVIERQTDILKWCILQISTISFIVLRSRGVQKYKKYLESIGATFVDVGVWISITINKKGD